MMARSLSEPSCLQVRGAVKTFGRRPVVDGLDMSLERGQILALIGPNGAGKTTTVSLCQGFLEPDSGQVRLLGADPYRERAVLKRVGTMLQDGGGYPGARAGELVRLLARFAANPLDPEWLLGTLGLHEVARTPYRRLSGGQQRKVSLACALVGRPEVVFLDEPTAGLDPESRQLIWELVDHLRQDGVGVLLTTHLLEEAEALADQVIIIESGRAVARGAPDDLASAPNTAQISFRAEPGLDLDSLRRSLPCTISAAETRRGRYLLDGSVTPRLLSAVTAWCADQDVLMTEIHVTRHSLEDVYWDVVGTEKVR